MWQEHNLNVAATQFREDLKEYVWRAHPRCTSKSHVQQEIWSCSRSQNISFIASSPQKYRFNFSHCKMLLEVWQLDHKLWWFGFPLLNPYPKDFHDWQSNTLHEMRIIVDVAQSPPSTATEITIWQGHQHKGVLSWHLRHGPQNVTVESLSYEHQN